MMKWCWLRQRFFTLNPQKTYRSDAKVQQEKYTLSILSVQNVCFHTATQKYQKDTVDLFAIVINGA